MESTRPSPPVLKESYASVGSDATAVSRQLSTPADEAGFTLKPNRRLSGQGGQGTPLSPVVDTHSVESDGPTKPHTSNEKLPENHVQFATYRHDKLSGPPSGIPSTPTGVSQKKWVPLPLRYYFWIPLVLFLILGAIGLEIALHFSHKNLGWQSKQSEDASNAMHYVYTLPPVIIAAVVVAMWTWTDIEIKKIQPYVDLLHGDSPPHRSLLLDYTRQNNFVVWTHAANNHHYLVALATLMVLLCLSFQPLASALLIVRDTWIQLPDVTMTNLQAVSLNQGQQFNDLTSFLAAAGYAGASVLYSLPPPPFVRAPYTVAKFSLPTFVNNGTAFVETTAIKSQTGCQAVAVDMEQVGPGAWKNTASSNGCSITWNVVNTTNTLFGTDVPDCGPDASPPQFSPVVFWFFTYVPQAKASATFCSPTISLWEARVGVDIRTGNVTQVNEIRPFTQSSKFSSLSANVTGDPLNGRAYNGIQFTLDNPDQFVLARENATQLQLPASIYQASVQTPEGYTGSFNSDALSVLSDQVYGIYLSLVARQIYFLPDNEDIVTQIKTFQKRVFLSDVAVHLLAVAMLILAFFGTIVHLFHREDRKNLRMRHEPGTIASAVSIGAQTGVGDVLAGRHAEGDIKEALRNKKFRIDPDTMKIVMEGEEGYETAEIPTSPLTRRKSIFEILQGQRTDRTIPRHPAGATGTPPRSPLEGTSV